MAKLPLKGGTCPDDAVADGREHSADRTDRFPGDARIRRHGFRIAGRPNEYTAIWSKGGRTYTQSEALAACDREDRGK